MDPDIPATGDGPRDAAPRRGLAARLRDHGIAVAFIVATGLAVYGQAAGFAFVNWDDDLHVLHNDAVTSPDQASWMELLLTPRLGYPIPVTVATYQVEYALAGSDAHVFHVTNLALHLLAAVLVYAAARRLRCGVLASTLAATLFAVHPATAEPACWISGRKDLVAAVLALAAVAMLPGLGEPARRRSRVPALLASLLALLAKPSTVLVPPVLAALDRPGRGRWLWAVPAAFAAAVVAATWHGEAAVGAVASGGGLATRVLGAAWQHARIVLQPFDLGPKYLDDPAGVPPDVLVLGGGVIVVALGLLALSWVRRHPSRVGLSLAAAAYLPVCGLAPLSRQYADSYVYLPMAGLALAGAAAVGPVMSRAAGPLRAASIVAALAVIAALGVTATGVAATWRDGVSLWSEAYRRYPDSPQVCRNFGNAYLFDERHEPESAVRVYRHCIETLGHREYFLKNLAIATFAAQDLETAAALFAEYRRLRPDDRSVDGYVAAIERATGPGDR